MSTFMAYFYVILFLGTLGFLNFIAGLFFDNRSNSNGRTTTKNNDTIRSQAPNKIKCRCTECDQIINLKDLSYHGPQTAKCPNCGMTKVEIIQTWGLH